MTVTPPDPARSNDDAQPDRRSPTTMPSRHRLTLPAVAALALVSLLVGALAAFADDAEPAKRQDRARAARAAAARERVRAARPATTHVMPLLRALHAARGGAPLPAPCAPAAKPPAAEPVPQDLLDAFGVLRRDRGAADELPADALTALRDRRLEPFDPTAARLLRTTADGGRAWVVPVRDVDDSPARFGCLVQALGKYARVVPARPVSPPRAKAPSAVPAVPAAAPTVTTAPVPTRPATVPPAAPAPVAPTPAPTDRKPQPGLAVVATGGAPAGAGGTFGDLVRGREQVDIDPCGGPGHDMLSVSGIVPDGVPAAFLTSADGTAVRADVTDNGYAFVVPRTKRPEQRYVVWTGGDGTPHVHPLTWTAFSGRTRCGTPPKGVVRVSPADGGICPYFGRSVFAPAVPAPGPRTRPVPPLLVQVPCGLAAPPPSALPQPPPAVRAPKPRRHG
ncbi:MAG TPA: hypothetical protein VK501_19855 [Baekduia sp.]|uniref:hypothetical protein n=1 Tax=Baekduia sp. TaxID=2600305 RepID=UPI002C87776A|nr:hypothetical protein [Baekduia sp.]HMJ36167.1 hypothetical protein [Baekduia sp.]